jgi:aldehyde dehydrogenase (NAD+)
MHTLEQIESIREKQAAFFSSGVTQNTKFRRESLKKLKKTIIKYDRNIGEALKKDLNKSSFEAYATETGLVLHELGSQIRNLEKWARRRKVRTPIFALPSRSFVYPEPYGKVFIISPWNYPFQLPMVPLIGAIAAGNVAIIRQSRFSPNTNEVIKKILNESFLEEHVAVIESEIEITEKALCLKWDLIFFTGSTQIGRKVYSEAAQNLTPVILELGGKSPVVVDDGASISVAATRIIWAKLINAGQTCISPDYLFVHSRIKNELIENLKSEIIRMYGENPIENNDYPKIVSEKAFDRLAAMIGSGKVIHGGRTNREKMSVEPTLLESTVYDKCMEDEIFGPVLPVIGFDDLGEVIKYINSREKPLAVYLFSSDRKKQERMLRETSSGACLINDLILHIANGYLPFGGVGESGMGRYHKKESFRAFSNMKAVMKSGSLIDIPMKYPPFKNKERIIRMFLK